MNLAGSRTSLRKRCEALNSLAYRQYIRGRQKLADGPGIEPTTLRSARFSRPVAHHCAPPSVIGIFAGDRAYAIAPVIAGLDPAIYPFRKKPFAKRMDPRVKPAGDGFEWSNLRLELDVPIEIVGPALVQKVRREAALRRQ